MKKLGSQLTSFLSYHNAVPIAFGLLFLGGVSAFAATAAGVLPLPAVVQPDSLPSEPAEVDVSALLSLNVDTFDFRPTVTNVVETDDSYTVSYSLQTLAPERGAWTPYEKTGDFSMAKEALGETGLQGYVVQKLRDIENGERSYLARAQEAEEKLAASRAAKPANAFAALIGLALNQIPVPKVEKPLPKAQPETPPMQNAESQMTKVSTTASSADTATSTLDATSDATTTTATISATSSPQAVTSTVVASTTPVTSPVMPMALGTTTPASSAATSTTPTPIQSQSTAGGTSNATSQSDATASSAESTATDSPQQTDEQNPAPDTTATSTTPAD